MSVNPTPEQIQELSTAVQAVQNLQAQINDLTLQLSQSIARGQAQEQQISQLTQVTPETKTSTYRVQAPEFFEGGRKELPKFFTQLELVFRSGGSQFITDEAKIVYACTFLRSTAYAWVQPHLEIAHDPIMSSWDAFRKALEAAFGDPNIQATAEASLTKLKQTGATSAYAAEFRRLAALTKWDTTALNYVFYSGLHDRVKDELAREDRPKELNELISKSIRIDDRLREREQEKKGVAPARGNNTPTAIVPASGMDIDAIGIGKKLTPEERKRREMPSRQSSLSYDR